MPYQPRVLSRAIQFAPESVEVNIWPEYATAASFVPSDDEAMLRQLRLPLAACAVHVPPESVEV